VNVDVNRVPVSGKHLIPFPDVVGGEDWAPAVPPRVTGRRMVTLKLQDPGGITVSTISTVKLAAKKQTPGKSVPSVRNTAPAAEW
jgi:hypothetical protein